MCQQRPHSTVHVSLMSGYSQIVNMNSDLESLQNFTLVTLFVLHANLNIELDVCV
jgi:hypothetical protein